MLGVLGTKGGSGRSTIAAALAVEAARRGQRVGLVDLDGGNGGGQRSLTSWWALRTQGLDLGERPIDLVRPEADHARHACQSCRAIFLALMLGCFLRLGHHVDRARLKRD